MTADDFLMVRWMMVVAFIWALACFVIDYDTRSAYFRREALCWVLQRCTGQWVEGRLLRRRCGLSAFSFAMTVRGLEKAGVVERCRNAHRRVLFRLTCLEV